MSNDFKQVNKYLKQQFHVKFAVLNLLKMGVALCKVPAQLGTVVPEKEVIHTRNLVNELSSQIGKVRNELRQIHVTRAFLKGVPYSKVEGSRLKPTPDLYWIPKSVGLSNVDWKIVYYQYDQWIQNDTPTRIFQEDQVELATYSVEHDGN